MGKGSGESSLYANRIAAVLVVTGNRVTQVLGTLADYAQMMGVIYHLPTQ